MTATAKSLGMTRTNYANASGWPDSRQVTTVRDQARLAVAIYQHFPKYYAFFQTRSFKYGKRTYNSHVPLLGVAGVEGMKTGYINASGYNLMTVTRKDDKHLVIIGFGFNSTKERNAKVSSQLSKYLSKARSGDYVQTAMIPEPAPRGGPAAIAVADAPVAPMPYPDFRDDADAVAVIAASDEGYDIVEAAQHPDEAVVVAATAPLPAARPVDLGMQPALSAATALADPVTPEVDVIGAWLSDNYKLGAPPAPLGATRPSAPLVPPVGIGDGGDAIDPMTSGGIGAAAPTLVADQPEPPPVAVAGTRVDTQPLPAGWVVQIGAAPTETGATSLLSDAASRIDDLTGFRPFVERFEKNGQIYFRARFGGFEGRDDATGMCNQLKKAKMSCLAMQS
jgi:D-alanyl-D-alanine carboxypeptidase